MSVLDVVPVGAIDAGDGPQWLIEDLWTEEAVGICPAPRPENIRDPAESPRMCTAL